MKELESKFLLEQGSRRNKVLRRALQELSWAGFLTHPRGTSQIHDIYYDTPDDRLQRAGWTLRRRDENGHCQFTCKQLTSPAGGVFSRQELEQTLVGKSSDDIADDLRRLRQGVVTELVARLLPDPGALTELFEVTTRRQRYELSNLIQPRSCIELALDRTNIRGATELDFVELEAELKQGPPELLSEVHHVFENQRRLIRSRVSKYQRGLQAAGREPVGRLPDDGPTLTPGSAWADLGIRHLNTQSRLLRRYEPLAWEAVHIEGVHQMRVSVRRIREALKSFDAVLSPTEDQVLDTEARWLGRCLGGVRDLDVHLRHIDGYAKYLQPDDLQLLGNYRSHLAKARSRNLRELRAALVSPRYQQLQQQLMQYIEQAEHRKLGFEFHSIEEMARAFVLPQLKKIVRHGRRIEPASPAEKLHKLRIEIKHLRYLLEFLREPYGQKLLSKATVALTELQDTLGDHQDACVARDQLKQYRTSHELGSREERVFERLLKLEEEKTHNRRYQFFKDWKRFQREEKKLKKLFA